MTWREIVCAVVIACALVAPGGAQVFPGGVFDYVPPNRKLSADDITLLAREIEAIEAALGVDLVNVRVLTGSPPQQAIAAPAGTDAMMGFTTTVGWAIGIDAQGVGNPFVISRSITPPAVLGSGDMVRFHLFSGNIEFPALGRLLIWPSDDDVDAGVQWQSGGEAGGQQSWITGVDASDSHRWKISAGNTLGVNDLLTLSPSGIKIGAAGVDNRFVDQVLSGAYTPDFASVASGTCGSAFTANVTGAATGDPVSLGVPPAAMVASGCIFQAWVSAADTVSIKVCSLGTACDPPAGATYRVLVTSVNS